MSASRWTRAWRALVLLIVGLLMTTGCSAAPAPQKDPALQAALAAVDAKAFMAKNPGLWVSVETGAGFESVSITNYDPLRLPPPKRQETAAYGKVGTGPETITATVYSVGVQVGTDFYVAEFDPETKTQLFEEGSWPLDEAKQPYIERQLALVDTALGR